MGLFELVVCDYIGYVTIQTQVIKYNNAAPGGSANQIVVFTANYVIKI